MAEYGEPWKLDGQRDNKPNDACMEVSKADGKTVLCADNWDGVCPPIEIQERIVAAINACAGVPTEDLVSGKARVVVSGGLAKWDRNLLAVWVRYDRIPPWLDAAKIEPSADGCLPVLDRSMEVKP